MLPTSKLFAVLFLLLLACATTFANNETPKQSATLTVTSLSVGKVQIETMVLDQSVVYILEKSYNNKKFTTVAVLMPNEAVAAKTTMKLKDSVKTNKKKVYYRLRISNSTTTSIEATNVIIL